MVMYPTATMGVGLVPETGFASALARAYNEWMHDFCAADPARLQYVALIAPQSVPDAVAELRRAVTELGAVGAMMPSHVHHRPDFGDPHYDPIYAEAQRLDVGLGFHPNTQSLAATLFHNFVNVHALSFPVEHFLTLSATIVGGVFERFPDLRVAYLESGIGWVPYLMHRLDRALELQGAAEAPHLTRTATETIRSGRLFFGTECEERTIADAVAWGLEDTLIFASDYPHWDADWPHTVQAVQERSDLTDAVKRKFLHDNALRFYGTPLRARMGSALVAATV
jgi:predicted TIM-barrel fold metal-dependent hydrolase